MKYCDTAISMVIWDLYRNFNNSFCDTTFSRSSNPNHDNNDDSNNVSLQF